VGLTASSAEGARGVLFYLLAYAFMNLGALTIVQLVGSRDEKLVAIEDYAGLGYRSPGLALALSLFLVSLAGIPLTGGFTGKLFLFAAAIQGGLYWLVVIAVVASAIGIYYYLRVLVLMYMREPSETAAIGLPAPAGVVLALMALGTLWLGVLPGRMLEWAGAAVQVFSSEASRF
jgi:NADH-quinone oxidoreductase subunit N